MKFSSCIEVMQFLSAYVISEGITPSCDGANQPVGSITFKVRRKAKEDMEEKAKERKVHKVNNNNTDW